MNPYLFTLSFLFLMSLLTSSEMVQHMQERLEKKCFFESRKLIAMIEEEQEHAHLDQLRQAFQKDDEKKEKKPPDQADREPKEKKAPSKRKSAPLRFCCTRPPNNSRLNAYLLLHKPPRNTPKGFSLYEVAARLLRLLYQNEEFFQRVPDIEYRILDALISKKEETLEFSTPDELSAISLEDETLQSAFYQMLRGTKRSASLLNFLTFDQGEKGPIKGQRRKINLMFADPMLLYAIFPDGHVADEILRVREKIWKEIFEQEAYRNEWPPEKIKNRKAFKGDLERGLTEILSQQGLSAKKYKSSVFDLGLGELGSIIFLEDQVMGKLERQRYKSGAHPKHNSVD